MIFGVPREIKPGEARVAMVPSGVSALVAHGHEVLVEKGAGAGTGIPDETYRAAGAKMIAKAAAIWQRSAMIAKVKEPLEEELNLMRPGQILYTYLHLASNEGLLRALLHRKVTAIGYETIQLDDGSLPLLTPMSEVAGKLSVQVGARCLEAPSGGLGVLLGGVSGVKPAKVVILGAGVAGSNACQVAVGMGAHVTVIDINPAKLRYLHDIMGGRVTTLMSNRANITEEVCQADLVIGSVLIPGAKAPKLITRDLVRQMRPNSAFVDIAIDQGGCSETSHATTHADPTYRVYDVVHYCVANMPGAVPHTSTMALTNATLGYGLKIADKGFEQAIAQDQALRRGVNTHAGKVTHCAVAEAFGMPCHDL
jgi:alanine dehydrogenase